MDKVLMDLATPSKDLIVHTLLVELLNQGNEEVRQAHESEKGQVIIFKDRLKIRSRLISTLKLDNYGKEKQSRTMWQSLLNPAPSTKANF